MRKIFTSLSNLSQVIFNMAFENTSETENIVVSPFSALEVISVLGNAAANKTKEEMEAVIGDITTLNTDMDFLMKDLKSGDRYYKLYNDFVISNFVFHRNNIEIKESFKEQVRKIYNPLVKSVDTSSKDTVGIMNRLISDATKGMIPNFLREVDPNMVVMIVNTLYFKGTWCKQFNIKNTVKEDFKVKTGIKKVDMMKQSEDFLAFMGPNYKAIKMDYVCSDFSFIAIQPSGDSDLKYLQRKLVEKGELYEIVGKMKKYYVDLSIPKFRIQSKFELTNPLKKHGFESLMKKDDQIVEMFTAFNELGRDSKSNANLDISNMITNGVCNPKMEQCAVIDFNEVGTEAAAATSFCVTDGIREKPEELELVFNEPFLYFLVKEVQDENKITHLPIFMGAFRNPENY